MKFFNLFALLSVFTLLFTSCSSNDTLLAEEQSLDLLKTYTINRDANGAYSLDYNLNGNVKTENVIDKSTNNIYLYSSGNQSSRKVTQNLTIDGTHLIIGFVDTNSDKFHNITIKDDNISLAKSSNENEVMLSEYGITSNEDGTYTLDFSVKNEVKVDFVYNEDIETYEIHLEEGRSKNTSFSRVLEKEEGKPLKFDFVNHIDTNTDAKSFARTSLSRKPEVIID